MNNQEGNTYLSCYVTCQCVAINLRGPRGCGPYITVGWGKRSKKSLSMLMLECKVTLEALRGIILQFEIVNLHKNNMNLSDEIRDVRVSRDKLGPLIPDVTITCQVIEYMYSSRNSLEKWVQYDPLISNSITSSSILYVPYLQFSSFLRHTVYLKLHHFSSLQRNTPFLKTFYQHHT